jgi:hypothetical protein
MPDESTKKRAEEDLREGKSPSTAAGEFVHEEIEHVREGKHGFVQPDRRSLSGSARQGGLVFL